MSNVTRLNTPTGPGSTRVTLSPHDTRWLAYAFGDAAVWGMSVSNCQGACSHEHCLVDEREGTWRELMDTADEALDQALDVILILDRDEWPGPFDLRATFAPGRLTLEFVK